MTLCAMAPNASQPSRACASQARKCSVLGHTVNGEDIVAEDPAGCSCEQLYRRRGAFQQLGDCVRVQPLFGRRSGDSSKGQTKKASSSTYAGGGRLLQSDNEPDTDEDGVEGINLVGTANLLASNMRRLRAMRPAC